MLVLQFVIPRQLVLPEAGVVHPFALVPARPAALGSQPTNASRPLFGSAAAGSVDVADAPVGGAIAIGVLARGGTSIGFLQAPDGSVASLSAGGDYHGWRLVTVGSTAILFRRGAETVALPVISHAAAVVPPVATATQR